VAKGAPMLLRTSILPRFVLLALTAAAIPGCGSDPSAPPQAAPPPPPEPPPPVVMVKPDAGTADPSGMPADWPYKSPVVVRSPKGMVVTDATLGTQAGRDILVAGGNAADAAVATAFALAVVFPTAGNIGGGGFAVGSFAGKSYALDFRETAPAAARRDMYLGADGKPIASSHSGILSAGIPGSVAGLHELFTKLGSKKLTWAQVLAPAIKLAKEGFPVDEAFVDTIKQGEKGLRASPGSLALYFPGGNPPVVGSTFTNPDLARTLERIVKDGPKAFYTGAIAQEIVKESKEDKGLITARDLASYKAKWRDPITFSYRGHQVTSMPPPSSGGVTLAMIANILSGFDLARAGYGSVEAYHDEFEAMRRAYAARNAKLGDPDFVKMPLAELLSPAWADAQRATIKPDHATPSSEIVSAPASGVGPHTTNFSVVDAEGNAIALTTTVNWWYGCGITVRGAGFVLNNEMDDFATVPGQANGFGLVQGEANAIAGGKRMLSSMTPTIVSGADGKPQLVLGAAGGPTIITAVFQEMSDVLDFGLDPARATAAPRFHMQHLPDIVMSEEHGITPETQKALEGMGYAFKARGHIADAPLIGREGADWVGIAEPRRKGGAALSP
jgi:gamma-glutamyltranspeptidase/glutathione hydrolase